MRIVLLGPPGAGKGTHARIMAEKHGMAHIAAGDTLRRHIKGNTPAGLKAKSIIEKGDLVPDSLINDIMNEEMWRTKAGGGSFILDGYPRTVGQAEALEKISKKYEMPIQAAVNLAATEPVILVRLGGRLACSQCGANYHKKNMPPKLDGICDKCGAALSERADDKPETIKNRLKVYDQATAPLIDYYRNKGLLQEINGDWEVPEVQAALDEIIDKIKVSQK